MKFKETSNEYGFRVKYGNAIFAHHDNSSYYFLVKIPFLLTFLIRGNFLLDSRINKLGYYLAIESPIRRLLIYESKKKPRYYKAILILLARTSWVILALWLILKAIQRLFNLIGYIALLLSKVLKIAAYSLMGMFGSARSTIKDFFKVEKTLKEIKSYAEGMNWKRIVRLIDQLNLENEESNEDKQRRGRAIR